MSYLYLAAAVVSLGALGMLHKVADHRCCRPQAINLFLFLWASAALGSISLVRFGRVNESFISGRGIAVAAICGACAGIAILNFQHGVRFGKISTSWLIINLSTVLPTALSIWLYHERVTWKRGLSLILAMGALVMLWIDRQKDGHTASAGEEPRAAEKGD